MATSDAGLAEENARLRAEVAALREQLAGCSTALDEAQRERYRERAEAAALREVARTVGSTLDVEAVLEAIEPEFEPFRFVRRQPLPLTLLAALAGASGRRRCRTPRGCSGRGGPPPSPNPAPRSPHRGR